MMIQWWWWWWYSMMVIDGDDGRVEDPPPSPGSTYALRPALYAHTLLRCLAWHLVCRHLLPSPRTCNMR